MSFQKTSDELKQCIACAKRLPLIFDLATVKCVFIIQFGDGIGPCEYLGVVLGIRWARKPAKVNRAQKRKERLIHNQNHTPKQDQKKSKYIDLMKFLRTSKLAPCEFRVLAYLLSLDPCYPSMQRIADDTGVSLRSVKRAIKSLDDQKKLLIYIRPSGDKPGKRYGYRHALTREPIPPEWVDKLWCTDGTKDV